MTLVCTLVACKATKQQAPATNVDVYPLRLEKAKRVGDASVIDQERSSPWSSSCQIHRACPALLPIPRCVSRLAPMEVKFIGNAPPVALGERLALRGKIGFGAGAKAAMLCESGCCMNSIRVDSFISHGSENVLLEGRYCGGDASRVCCDIPAVEGTVVALGTLQPAPTVLATSGVRWSLRRVELCSEQ